MQTDTQTDTGFGKAQAVSKRRRLNFEIDMLLELVKNTEDMVKHDPYQEDIPQLKQDLKNARFDLENAIRERGNL